MHKIQTPALHYFKYSAIINRSVYYLSIVMFFVVCTYITAIKGTFLQLP